VEPIWVKAARYAGLEPDTRQIEDMERYRHWLATEAVTAGGIGPEEIARLERRHLADSVLFASVFPENPTLIWDLGTGVGLPGIPLAILMPETEFVLVDRSGRRVDLLRRVIRILDLGNCQPLQQEIDRVQGDAPVIVSRATLPPERLLPVMEKHLSPGGIGVTGGSWTTPPHFPGWITAEIPRDVLDQPVWLLMMRRA
jgi:16S rRNA (guanine527-N7)-methyltransferase